MLESSTQRQRVSTFLESRQVELLDHLSRQAKFSGGAKLSHALILQSLVDVLGKLPVDVSGVRSNVDLEDRVLRAMREFVGHRSPV